MRRRWPIAGFASLLLLPNTAPAGAQTVAVAASAAAGIGYIFVSFASIHRLLQFGEAARVGDDVRLTVRSSSGLGQTRGRLAACDGDSVVLDIGDGRRAFAKSDIRSADVYGGMESKWAQGWGLGMAIGGGGLAAVGLASGNDHHCFEECMTAFEKAALLGFLGGVTGSSVGVTIGALTRDERWDRVTGFENARVSVLPIVGRSNGFGIQVAF